MRQTKENLLSLGVYFLDVIVIVSAVSLAYLVRDVYLGKIFSFSVEKSLALRLNYTVIFVQMSLIPFFAYFKSYIARPFLNQLFAIFKLTVISFLVVIFISYFLKSFEYSRLHLATIFAMVFSFLVIERYLVKLVLLKGFYSVKGIRNVVIIGTSPKASDVKNIVRDFKYLRFSIYGFLYDHSDNIDKKDSALGDIPFKGDISGLKHILDTKDISEVFFIASSNNFSKLFEIISLCSTYGVKVRLFFETMDGHLKGNINIYSDSLPGNDSIVISNVPEKYMLLMIKRAIDILLCIAGILLFCPIMVAVSIIIKLTSHGPTIFTQIRSGLYGKSFKMLKFRSMVSDAEFLKEKLETKNEVDGPAFKIKNDPRVTKIGKFIRKTSIDELPQLFNVLLGDMSIVGPRPPIPEEVQKYESWQRRRLSMKPGLTCIWQVSGRNHLSFQQWMEMDLEYIDSWSLLLDFKLILKTVYVVLTRKGAY